MDFSSDEEENDKSIQNAILGNKSKRSSRS